MASIDIKIPQMGEGLTEVRLLEFMKTPGDSVLRDEIIYSMETDKATLEVESSVSGTLTEWLAAEGDVLPIGAAVARIEETESSVDVAAEHAKAPSLPAAPAAPVERIIPPRTRAYARELGLSDAALLQIPSATGKLMPSDLDAFVKAQQAAEFSVVPDADIPSPLFQDRPLPDRQRKLNFHMRRSAQVVVPGTIGSPIAWEKLRDFVAKERQHSAATKPTEFQVFAFCVVRAAIANPKFRCVLIREDTVRQFERLHLGVAVALPEGELTTAVVPEADLLPFERLIAALQERIHSARAGNDQADASVQLLLSYLGANGVRDAVPVLVAPAAAVIFLGESYENGGSLFSNVALTFDHRLMNGIEAAAMLKSIAEEVERLDASA